MREAEVRHFCYCAFLSEKDVPEKEITNVPVFCLFLVRHLAARSPCTILCCSRNSIPRLTCSKAKTSSLSVFVSFRKLLPESYISQESCCSMAQTPTGSEETTDWAEQDKVRQRGSGAESRARVLRADQGLDKRKKSAIVSQRGLE